MARTAEPTADPVAEPSADPAADPTQADPTERASETEAAPTPQELARERIDELTRLRHAAERTTHEAERKAAYWEGRATSTPASAQGETDAKPKQDEFESYESYLEAVADWKISERLDVERERFREQSRSEFIDRGFEGQMKAAREAHADFDSVARAETLSITDHMATAIKQAQDGAEIWYHLGKNPDDAARIASLSPVAQIMEIGKLAAKSGARRQSTPLAEPITPLRGGDGQYVKDPSRMSDAEWFESVRGRK